MSFTAGPGTTYLLTSTQPVPTETANGVLYLDGNKVPSTSSGLTFDGTTFSAPSMSMTNLSLSGDLTLTGANGEATLFKEVTDTLTGMSGATVSATSLIPANCLLIGVTTRVITEITGCTSINIGISGDADAFAAGTALLAGTTTNIANFTITAPLYFTGAASVVITAVGGGASFTAGAIRVTAHYIRLTAATS